MKFTIYAIRYECIGELLQTHGTYSAFLHKLCVAKVNPWKTIHREISSNPARNIYIHNDTITRSHLIYNPSPPSFIRHGRDSRASA